MTFNPKIFFYILMAWFSMSNATVQLSRPGLTWSKRRHCKVLSLLSEQTVSVSEQRLSTSAQYQNLIYQPCCSPAELHRPAGWAVWYLPLFNYRKQVSLKIKSEFWKNVLLRHRKCFISFARNQAESRERSRDNFKDLKQICSKQVLMFSPLSWSFQWL